MKITYLIHSSFALEIEDKVFLFDYPSERYISERLKETISKIVKDSDLYVFISHSHPDHYNPKIFELYDIAKKAVFVLSDDINLKSEDRKGKIKVVEPDKKYQVDGISINTFKSNDEGVAFLIEISDTKIYYGGDLAKWDWPEFSEEERMSKVNVFDDVLDELKDLDIDIAFSNMDERLESWAGPVDFIKTVRPDLFIPIHTFGNEEWIDDLLEVDLPEEVGIFNYHDTGDTLEI